MKHIKIKTPDNNELWYYSNNKCYYVIENGRLYHIYLELDTKNVYKLLESIQNIGVSDVRETNCDILDGRGSWEFIAEDWKEYVKEICKDKIDELNLGIGECILSIGKIKCLKHS